MTGTTLQRPARSVDAGDGNRDGDREIWRGLFDRVFGSDLADQLDGIAFDVRSGQVTLTGELRHWADIPRLINLAWEEPGVVRVDEFLHRCGESLTEDAVIRRAQLAGRPAA